MIMNLHGIICIFPTTPFTKSSTVMVFGRVSTQYISTRQAMQHFVNLAPCKAFKVCNEVLCVLGIV